MKGGGSGNDIECRELSYAIESRKIAKEEEKR
jgi:hypothetical protein